MRLQGRKGVVYFGIFFAREQGEAVYLRSPLSTFLFTHTVSHTLQPKGYFAPSDWSLRLPPMPLACMHFLDFTPFLLLALCSVNNFCLWFSSTPVHLSACCLLISVPFKMNMDILIHCIRLAEPGAWGGGHFLSLSPFSYSFSFSLLVSVHVPGSYISDWNVIL